MKSSPLGAVIVAAIWVCLGGAISGCGSRIQGTYTAPGGNYELQLKSGGKASLKVGGVTDQCTYTLSGSSLTLTCDDYDDSMILTVHDDGSLTCLPGTPLPTLRKK